MVILQEMIEEAISSAQKIVAEGKDRLEWGEKVVLSEIISTSEGGKQFVEKTNYDAFQGRENVPLLYKGIYTTLVNADFPEAIIAKGMGAVEIVFVKKMENENVRFGRIAAGEEQIVKFATYAAGIDVTEDMIEYNKTWEITEMAVAFGEAYNKLLNHLHLSPIISATYVTTAGGLSAQRTAQKDGTAQLIAFATDIETTLTNALTVLGTRNLFVLANSLDQVRLENAIASALYNDNQTPTVLRRTLDPANFVYYDGDEVVVGEKEYVYDGVVAGAIIMGIAKKNFREYIKHDLRLSPLEGDLNKLTAGGYVGRARRAVAVAVASKFGAVKVALE